MRWTVSLFFVSFLFSVLTSAGSGWGDPSDFLENEEIEVTDLHPAVSWSSARGDLDGRPIRAHVITADLKHAEIGLQALAGERFVNTEAGQRFRRSTTTEMLEDNTALAAINVAFFDIGGTQAPEGILLQNGVLLREPAPGRAAFALLGDDTAAIIEPGWRGNLRIDGRRRDLVGVNSPRLNDHEIGLYRLPWVQSPGAVDERRVTEILVRQRDFQPTGTASGYARLTGEVQEVRESGDPFAISEEEFVVTAYGNAVGTLRGIEPGKRVEIAWQLTGVEHRQRWHEIREAVGAGDILIRNDEKRNGNSPFWNDRHPRSAGAIDRSGERIMLVVVDGRSTESAGINLSDLADFLRHMGAYQAVNFDGGGSSALAANVDGEERLLNTPSDGRERYVPTALGIFVAEPAESIDGTRTWTGANGTEMKGVLHHFDPATKSVTMTLDGRRFTFPLSSLSEADQELILEQEKEKQQSW